MKRRILVLSTMALITACNHRPNQVIDAAQVAGVELAAIKAEANRQQQVMNGRIANLSQSANQHLELAKDFEHRAQSLPLLWRIRDDKARLLFFAEIKAGDNQLIADPYLLVRRPPGNAGATVIDTAGLDNAIAGVGLIANQPPLTVKQGASELFDALRNIELPAQPKADSD